MQRLAGLFLVIAGFGCSAPAARTTVRASPPGPANELVGRMLLALETEDTAAWRDLLSAPMRAKLDEGALHDHLMGWRRDVLPLAADLRGADLAVDDAEHVVTYAVDGAEPVALAGVVDEGGVLRLDEN
jgi:hypothetical protein